jgi:hypothetical protein
MLHSSLPCVADYDSITFPDLAARRLEPAAAFLIAN